MDIHWKFKQPGSDRLKKDKKNGDLTDLFSMSLFCNIVDKIDCNKENLEKTLPLF